MNPNQQQPIFQIQRAIDRVSRIIDPSTAAFRNLGGMLNLQRTQREGHVDYRAPRGMSFRVRIGRIIDDTIQDRHARYFHIPVHLTRGEFLSDFSRAIEREILAGIDRLSGAPGSEKLEGDEDSSNYRVLGIKEVIDGQDDMLDDEDMENYAASHNYQPVELEKFAIKKLKMREFTCIFEALMVIQFVEQDESHSVPQMNNGEWELYVRAHFANLTIEDQNMFYDQHMWKCVEWFVKTTGIKVGIFDAHRYEQEMRTVLDYESEGCNRYKYYLIYWGEHVFPASGDTLEDIVKNQRDILSKFQQKYERLFCMIPHIFGQLHLEAAILAIRNNGRIYDYTDEQFKVQFLPDFAIRNVVAISPAFATKFKTAVQWQKAYHTTMRGLKELTADEATETLLAKGHKEADLLAQLNVYKRKVDQYYFDADDYDHYKRLLEFRTERLKAMGGEQFIADSSIRELDEKLAKKSSLWKKRLERQDKYDKFGRGFFDIETYIDNSLNSDSAYNMIPFVACFVGDMQRMFVDEVEFVDKKGKRRMQHVQKTEMVYGIKQYFTGLYPGECIRKFVFYLMSNNFVYSDQDYTKLRSQGDHGERRHIYNYIFAHNGFGFDFRFLQDELHSSMREFRIVGDSTNTKCLSGNGLFFMDFSLIYRDSLKNLATTFFPNNRDFQKLECDLVIDLPKATVAGWYEEAKQAGIDISQQKEMKTIIEYCMRDCVALQQIVNKFFKDAYSTPFGHGFLPMCFYHSLSSLAYSMFQNCYLTMPIFCNKAAIEIEQGTKAGGFTDGNCIEFSIGVFIDVTSFYPSVMMNDMPVRYKIPDGQPLIIFKEPKRYYEDSEEIRNINIYKITFKFPEDTALPIITQKTSDTLVAVLQSQGFDERQSHDDCDAIYVFGYMIKTALETIPGTQIIIYGHIEYEEGDKIFKKFIEDQYSLRQTCKKNGDKIGDMFHKNLMNSAQGKIGQKVYDKVFFGGAQFIKDMFHQLSAKPDISNIYVHQVLSDKIDLFELKYGRSEDKWMQTGNTVRIPSYIMSVARTHLLRMQNNVATCLGSPDVIGYYDTDSILIKMDKNEKELNERIQIMFDQFLRVQKFLKDTKIPFFKEFLLVFTKQIANLIGGLIHNCATMGKLNELNVRDVTKLDEKVYDTLIHDTRLGACKIEKYVIRGVVLGPKQYGVYFVEGVPGNFVMKQSVKLKGVKAHARKMEMVQSLKDKTVKFMVNELGVLPFEYTEIMKRWSRMGGGVIISDVRKIVRVTLTKRRHVFDQNTSRPFKDIAEFQQYKDEYEQKFKKMKTIFVDSLQQSIEELEQSESVQKFKQALREQIDVRQTSSTFFGESIKMLRESRKRYMMRLPSIKFEQLQDKVYDMLCEDKTVCDEAFLLLPKLYLICYHAVLFKKQTSRRGLRDLTDDNNCFSVEKAARCLAYCLFIFYFLKRKEMPIPENFVKIMSKMHKYFIAKMLGNESELSVQRKERCSIQEYNVDHVTVFNQAIIYGFEFLQAPICIYSPKGPNIKVHDINDVPIREGEYKLRYSNLWRFFYQLQDNLEVLADSPQNTEDVFMQLIQETVHDDKLDLRGPNYFHKIFARDNNPRYDLHNNQFLSQDNHYEQRGWQPHAESVDRSDMLQAMNQGGLVTQKLKDRLRDVPKLHYDRDDWIEPELLDENIKDVTEQKVAMMVLMGSQLHRENLNLEDYSVSREQVFNEIRKKFAFQTDFNPIFMETLFNVASKGKITKSDKVCQEDVYDMVILYSFLRYGKKRSALIFKALRDDLCSKLEKGKLGKYNLFDQCCQVLFCRPYMFKVFRKGSASDMSKRQKKLVDIFIQLTTEFDKQIVPDDEHYIAHMDMLFGDRAIVGKELGELFDLCKTNEIIKGMGASIFNKVLKWRNPDAKVVCMLKAVLMVDNFNWTDDLAQSKKVFDEKLDQIARNMQVDEEQFEFADDFDNLKIQANKIDLGQIDQDNQDEEQQQTLLSQQIQQVVQAPFDPALDFAAFDEFLNHQDLINFAPLHYNNQFDWEEEDQRSLFGRSPRNDHSLDLPIYLEQDRDEVRNAHKQAQMFMDHDMFDYHAMAVLNRVDEKQALLDETEFLKQCREQQVRDQQNIERKTYIGKRFYEQEAEEGSESSSESDIICTSSNPKRRRFA